ncbi:MAG: hypothetical protein ACKVOQ_14345 [Cyclobacteriaceae bacterium]
MRISEFISTIKKENPVLYWCGLLNITLFAVCFVLYFFDSRLVMGINPWIKPMKFGLSVGIYCWTFAWLLRYLVSKGNVKFISWVIIVCMIAENAIITLQAARGVISHYNISSGLDALLFSVMGAFIGINTMIIFYTLVVFLFTSTTLDKNMLLAWRLGLLLFLVGGVAGGMMIGNLSHTVGASDGTDGIAFLNWSKVVGDLRSAHFITMHGLQVIPLFAFLVSSKLKRPQLLTAVFFFLYSVFCLRLHQVALDGKPFFDLF